MRLEQFIKTDEFLNYMINEKTIGECVETGVYLKLNALKTAVAFWIEDGHLEKQLRQEDAMAQLKRAIAAMQPPKNVTSFWASDDPSNNEDIQLFTDHCYTIDPPYKTPSFNSFFNL